MIKSINQESFPAKIVKIMKRHYKNCKIKWGSILEYYLMSIF